MSDGKDAQDGRRRLVVWRRADLRPLSFCCPLFVAVVAAFLVGVASAADVKKAPASPAPFTLDDVPQPLTPKQPQTEAGRDHLEAIAQFAAGTMHERRGEYAEALRCYERAYRCDPKSSSVLRSVIAAAVRLKRHAEAVRYALKSAELDDADPIVLRGLGGYLSEEGDWNRAITLYEKAIAARGKSREIASDVLVRMELGRLYYLVDKPKKAAECFARVLYAIDHPDDFALDQQLTKILLSEPGITYQLMGECFLAADMPADAKAVFERADKVAPDKALREFNRARLLWKENKPAEALAALEASFAGHLTDQGTSPYETLADILTRQNKKDELLGRLEKLHAAEPKNAPLAYYLAGQYTAAGQYDKAELLYLRLLRVKPTLTGFRSFAELTRKTKHCDALLTVLGEAVEKTGVLDILGAEAQSLSSDAETMRGIIDAARSRIKASPDKLGYGARLAVATLALEAKQYETAGEFFNLALAIKDRKGETPKGSKDADATAISRAAEVLMTWGVGLLLGDRAADAAKVFQRGIDEKVLPDDNPAFHFYLAGALAVAMRPDEALAAARIAAEKKKDSARFQGRAAWVLYMTKRYAESAKAYRELIAKFDADHASTENRDVLREARLAMSNLCVLQGDFAQAEEWLEQVLDEFPDDEGALNDLGYLWADQNKHVERAERMTRKAVEAQPNDKAYRDSYGWALYRRGKYNEALAELEKAVDPKKPDGVVLDHLGDVYEKLGRRDKAVESWRKAVEVLRGEKEAEKAAAVEKKLGNAK